MVVKNKPGKFTEKQWESFVNQFGEMYPIKQLGVLYHDEGVADVLWDGFKNELHHLIQSYKQKIPTLSASSADAAFREFHANVDALATKYSVPKANIGDYATKLPSRKRNAHIFQYGTPGTPQYHQALVDKYGQRMLGQAAEWCRQGMTAEQLRLRLRTNSYAVKLLMDHFKVMFPKAFQCGGCDRMRTKGLVMVPQPDGKMLCWVCDGKVQGRYAERNAKLDEVARRYSEGERLEDIQKDMGLHWTDVNLVIKTRSVRRRCGSCERERRSGVAFGKGLYVHPHTKETRYLATCRRCLEANELAGYQAFIDPDAESAEAVA